MKKTNDAQMGFIDHLDEFRNRIIISLVSWVIITIACYFFSEKILNIIISPIPQKKLIFFSPSDALIIRIKIAMLSALFFALPIILLEIWKFISPALNKSEKKFVFPLIFCALLLFYIGSLFAYYTLPYAVNFLLQFSSAKLQPALAANNYISFFINLTLAFALTFEFPIVVLILAKIGLVTPDFLIKKRKQAILIIFIVAAVITPTQDAFTLLLMAIPLTFFYEVSIIITKIVYKKRIKEQNN